MGHTYHEFFFIGKAEGKGNFRVGFVTTSAARWGAAAHVVCCGQGHGGLVDLLVGWRVGAAQEHRQRRRAETQEIV